MVAGGLFLSQNSYLENLAISKNFFWSHLDISIFFEMEDGVLSLRTLCDDILCNRNFFHQGCSSQ